MLNSLLPQHIDNTYRGHKLALWLLGMLVLLKVIIAVNSMVNGYSVASSADGIPLDTYPSAAAQTIVSIFALLGFSQFLISLLCVLVLVRYRALVPLMFAILLLDYLGRKLVLQMLPIAKTGTPPGFYVSLVILALILVGLMLSLWSRDKHPALA